MILDPARCPECGQPPRGTVERVAGCAEFIMPEDGEEAGFDFQYSGYTEVWLDELHTVEDENGKVELVCPDGHCWYAAATETAAQ